jgi:hypothetical protein
MLVVFYRNDRLCWLALRLQLITPFTSTISDGSKDVLIQINAILWAELWLTPGLRLLDLVGNLKKHLLAPRAMNQETMNLNFQGASNEHLLKEATALQMLLPHA